MFLMAQESALHVQHSVLVTRGEIPVHAEPIQFHLGALPLPWNAACSIKLCSVSSGPKQSY